MNTMEPGNGNSSKENSIKSKWIKKSIDPSYFAMIAVIASMVFGFWNMSTRLDAIDEKFDKKFDAVNARFDGVNARFDDIYGRFDGVYRRFDAVNLRIDDLYGRFGQLQDQRTKDNKLLNERFMQLQDQRIKDNQLLNERFIQLQDQRIKDNQLLREELRNQFERLNGKIEETNDNFKEELMALSNKVEDLRVRVDSIQPQNSASPDNESIVENETSGVKDLNKSSNHSKVSLSANQELMSIGT